MSVLFSIHALQSLPCLPKQYVDEFVKVQTTAKTMESDVND